MLVNIARGKVGKRACPALPLAITRRVIALDVFQHVGSSQLAGVSQAKGVSRAKIVPTGAVDAAVDDLPCLIPGWLNTQRQAALVAIPHHVGARRGAQLAQIELGELAL